MLSLILGFESLQSAHKARVLIQGMVVRFHLVALNLIFDMMIALQGVIDLATH